MDKSKGPANRSAPPHNWGGGLLRPSNENKVLEPRTRQYGHWLYTNQDGWDGIGFTDTQWVGPDTGTIYQIEVHFPTGSTRGGATYWFMARSPNGGIKSALSKKFSNYDQASDYWWERYKAAQDRLEGKTAGHTYDRRYAYARKESFPDGEGPKTPWGSAQYVYTLERGVRWVSTPGHGGLGVSNGVARKKLSPAARRVAGEHWGGSFWFEEDVAYTVAFYENPEWAKSLASVAGGTIPSKDQLEAQIKRYYPKYFELADLQDKPKAKTGIQLVLQSGPISFGRGTTFEKGDLVEVTKVTSTSLIVRSADGKHHGLFRMPYRWYESGMLAIPE